MLIKNYNNFTNPQSLLLKMINSGIKEVLPKKLVEEQIKKIKINKFNNIYVIGFGKASSDMASGLEKIIGDKITKGIVIDTVKKKLKKITVIKGTHPLPSQTNVNATKKIIQLVSSLSWDDLVICLVSGGGSSLLCYPKISLKDYIKKNKQLLHSGLSIQAVNKQRKKYSNVKGGKLAKIIGTKPMIINLILSDVIGDPLDVIASGPTISKQKNIMNVVIGNNTKALKAVHQKAIELRLKSKIYPKPLTRNVAIESLRISRELRKLKKGQLIIFGGETTVVVKGRGKGGRNQELCLRLINKIKNKNIVFAAVATDGIDNTPVAGAIIDGNSYNTKFDINSYIKNNDSYSFFKKTKSHIITGKTGTNVCDIMVGFKY